MEIAVCLVSFVLGVVTYRLGRKEGEAGRVLPLVRRPKAEKEADKLLRSIESYK